MSATFTFEIVSPKFGCFVVIAPERFRAEIEARTWYASFDPKRHDGGQFIPCTNIRRDGRQVAPLKIHQLIWALAGRAGIPDHIDRQPLNNSEDNLREATVGQNGMNRQRQRNNASGKIGVYRNPRPGRPWLAQIRAGKKHYYLGSFDDIEAAARARDEAARRLHGEFAMLNGVAS